MDPFLHRWSNPLDLKMGIGMVIILWTQGDFALGGEMGGRKRNVMLFMLRAKLAKPAKMSNKDFRRIWQKESEATLAELKWVLKLNPLSFAP